MKLFYLFVFLLLGFGQSSSQAFAASGDLCTDQKIVKTFKPTYAKGFEIQYYNDFKIIKNLFSKSAVIQSKRPLKCQTDLYQIKNEINRIVLTSTTYLPLLVELHGEKKLVGFQGKKYISGKQFDLSKVTDLDYELSKEALVGAKSDLVIAYDLNLKNPTQEYHQLKIPLVLNDDYKEDHPMARLEWIIYNASFFNEEDRFIKIFNEKKKRYLDLKNQIKKRSPVVLIGDIQGGTWATPGSLTNLGILFKDAGAILALDISSNKTQFLNLEYVINLKQKPEYWFTNNFWNSKSDIIKEKENHIYSRFLKTKIVNNNKKQNERGYNEFWQSGQYYPDQILKDLINILQNNSQELIWYKELK